MKIIFFGTSEFAVPALEALVRANYNIASVVTQPDKPAGRKQEPLPSPVKLAALKLGLKVLQPASLFFPPQAWGGIKGEVELFVVVSYGKIIPKEVLDLPKFGALNLHPSLLPKYRGPSPIQAAILNGDKETGVTIIKLDEVLDHGPIVSQSRFEIRNTRFDYKTLHDKLAGLGAELLIKKLAKYLSGEIKPVPQEDSQATFTKRITKDDGLIDWSKSADQIDRLIRAYHLWPVAWTTLDGKRLKIYESEVLPFSPGEERSWKRGRVVVNEKKQLTIDCADGALQIHKLQPEAGHPMSARDFLNGNPGLSGKISV